MVAFRVEFDFNIVKDKAVLKNTTSHKNSDNFRQIPGTDSSLCGITKVTRKYKNSQLISKINEAVMISELQREVIQCRH